MFKINGTEVSRQAFCSRILFNAYAVPHCANHLVIFCLIKKWLYQIMHFVTKLIFRNEYNFAFTFILKCVQYLQHQCYNVKYQYQIYKTFKQNIRNVTLNDSKQWPQKVLLLYKVKLKKTLVHYFCNHSGKLIYYSTKSEQCWNTVLWGSVKWKQWSVKKINTPTVYSCRHSKSSAWVRSKYCVWRP